MKRDGANEQTCYPDIDVLIILKGDQTVPLHICYFATTVSSALRAAITLLNDSTDGILFPDSQREIAADDSPVSVASSLIESPRAVLRSLIDSPTDLSPVCASVLIIPFVLLLSDLDLPFEIYNRLLEILDRVAFIVRPG